jgi:nucleotide-binding universal stress UspA family protein
MEADIIKLVVVPIDGSGNSLGSLDYLNLMFGSEHHLKVNLCSVLPALPPILVEESRKDREIAKKLKEMEKKNVQVTERFLEEARQKLLDKGFAADRILTTHQKRKIDIARDICVMAANRRADALAISTRGRSRLAAFFMGETANKVLECNRHCPVWLVKGKSKSKNVLIAIDGSENALRAVDHAGFMLSGTDAAVTIFHTKRNLRRFVPKEVLDTAPELEDLWKTKAGQDIAPHITTAKEVLLKAGLEESQISIKIIDGTRSEAADILKETDKGEYGTIVIGRRGASEIKDFSMGNVLKKILVGASDTVIWIVD